MGAPNTSSASSTLTAAAAAAVEEQWLPATVVRHRGADAVDVELDARGEVVENVTLSDIRNGEEEEDRAAAEDASGGVAVTGAGAIVIPGRTDGRASNLFSSTLTPPSCSLWWFFVNP